MPRHLLPAALLATLLGAVACDVQHPDVTMDLVPRVAVVEAVAPPPTVRRTLLGVLEARRDAVLAGLRPGRVVARRVEPGHRVAEGDVLLQLDDREARANVALAEAALADAEVVRDDARQQRDRVEALGDGASDAQRQAAATGLARAEAAVARAGAQLRLARLEVDHMALRAPFDGEVALLDPEVGELVGAGAPVARVVTPAEGVVRLGLLEDEVGPAARATFTLVVGGRRHPAALAHVSPAADPRTLDWRAELVVEAPPWPPGTPVEVQVELPGAAEGVIVPPSAVYAGAVWVVRGEAAHRVPVEEVGEVRGGLLVRGPAAGERVVVHGAAELSEGGTVAVVERAP